MVRRSPSPSCPPTGRDVGVRHPRAVGAGVWAWGPVTNPTARALASWLCALWGQHEGARGGRPLPWCGASGVGRSPGPDHPLFRACGRGPLPAGPGGGVRAWGPSCLCFLVPCRGSSCAVRASRVCGTRWPLWLGTCPCAVVVAGDVPLWRASWPRVGPPLLVRSGLSRCSGWLCPCRVAFPHPAGCCLRLYWVAARGTWRPAENRAHCACRWPLPRQGRWARSVSYPFGAPRWGCPWRVSPASVLGCVRCGGLACVDAVTDASVFPYRPSFDEGVGRFTGAVSCGRRHRPFRVGGRRAWVPRVCVCVLFLAGSGGPASRARWGAPHLFFWPFLVRSLLVRPPPGRGFPVCGCCWVFFFFLLPLLVAPTLCPALRVFRPRVPSALASCRPPPPPFPPPPLPPLCAPLSPVFRVFRPRVPWALTSCCPPPLPPPVFFCLLPPPLVVSGVSCFPAAFGLCAPPPPFFLFPLFFCRFCGAGRVCASWAVRRARVCLGGAVPVVALCALAGFVWCWLLNLAVLCCLLVGLGVVLRWCCPCVAAWLAALWFGVVCLGVPLPCVVFCCAVLSCGGVLSCTAGWLRRCLCLLFVSCRCASAVCVLGCRALCSLSSPPCAVLCCAVLVPFRCAVRVVCAVPGGWCCWFSVSLPFVGGLLVALVARRCRLVVCVGFGACFWSGRRSASSLWCPAPLCCVLWRCAAVWCCAVVPCLLFLFFSLPVALVSCCSPLVMGSRPVPGRFCVCASPARCCAGVPALSLSVRCSLVLAGLAGDFRCCLFCLCVCWWPWLSSVVSWWVLVAPGVVSRWRAVVCPWALCCAVLLRVVPPGVALLCTVSFCFAPFGAAARHVVSWGAVCRLGVCVLLWCVAAWCCSPLCFVPCAPWGVVLCVSCCTYLKNRSKILTIMRHV